MSTSFNGNNFVLPNDTRTVNLAAKASTAISVGDFVCWDATDKVLVPVDVSVAGVTDSAANIALTFAGVASQTHLATDSTGGYPVFPAGYFGVSVQTDAVYNATIASGSIDVGTLVKAVAGSPTTVAPTTQGDGDAIGYVVAQYDNATTKVRVRLISNLFSPYCWSDNKN
jgi:hypothetical protein